MRLIVLLLAVLLISPAIAQVSELGEPPPSARDVVEAQEDNHAGAAPHTGMTLPYDATWAGVIVILIFGMFVAAALVGPVARANAPEEPPPAHSHDEPPGASHHHGNSGLANPEPGHGDDHGHAAHH